MKHHTFCTKAKVAKGGAYLRDTTVYDVYHVTLFSLLQRKYCKYDYTVTVSLTYCVHSNVYVLGNIQ